MGQGINKVMLLGNLGADPELRWHNQKAKLKLRLATNERWRDKDDKPQEKTSWHNVSIWGNRAEALERILKKGERIFVEGKIDNYSYDGPDGQKKFFTEVHARDIVLLGSKGGRAGMAPPVEEGGYGSDDIPFEVTARPSSELDAAGL